MNTLKKLLLGLAALSLLLAVVGVFLPDTAHVERSITIKAPPEQVHAVLNGYTRFNEWSPWSELDPKAKYEYSGPASGVGAKMSWASADPGVGTGSWAIMASSPELIQVALDFGPDGQGRSFFRLEPVDGGTRVTWGFDTSFEGNIVGRYVGLMFDSLIGKDYEKGLAKLRLLLERGAG